MTTLNDACMLIADIAPLLTSLGTFVYGVKHFFKKGKAYYLQIVTMAMGCYAMGSLYHLCQSFTTGDLADGFTAAYLGRIGFFLFLFTANYGQMDGLLDDRTPTFKKYRYIALIAPAAAVLLYLPCLFADMPYSTKLSLSFIWVGAILSSYFNFKHAIISDLGFGFAKAIRPYNICALILTFTELLLQVFWAYYTVDYILIVVVLLTVVFSVMSVVTMVALRRGVEEWKI